MQDNLQLWGMKYTMTEPCNQCPFTSKLANGFFLDRLYELSSGQFPCHKTATQTEEGYVANDKSVHCAGALIFLEKRNAPNQMMRVAERLGMYDRTKLKMDSDVR